MRLGKGNAWPLFEFWKDTVLPYRKIVGDFVGPLMDNALKKVEEDAKNGVEGEEEALFDYMVKQTQGVYRILLFQSMHLMSNRSESHSRSGRSVSNSVERLFTITISLSIF